MNAGHIEFVTTDAGQPYLVRVIADNGAELFRSSENYADEHDAERAALLLAQMFGAFSPEILRVSLPDGDEGHLFGCRSAVPVRYVDERTMPAEPVIPPERIIPPAKKTAPKRPRKTATKRTSTRKRGAK